MKPLFPIKIFLDFSHGDTVDSDPYLLCTIFFKGLVLFVRGTFSKNFRVPKREWLFHRCFNLIAFNCGDRQHVDMGTTMELRGCCPVPRMHIFAVLSSVVHCFFLDFQILCPLVCNRSMHSLCFKSDQMVWVCSWSMWLFMSFVLFDGQSNLTKSTQTPLGIYFSYRAEKEEGKTHKMGLGDSFPPSVTIMCQDPGGITATFGKVGLHK